MRKILLISCVFVLGLFSFAHAKARYISLAPSTTEILFALGLNEDVVGVSSYCDYPPEAKTKENVGDFSRPNIEKIIYLKPDYVFCTGLEQAPVISELKRLKINVYVSDPSNIDDLIKSINDIAKITSRDKEAKLLIADMQAKINSITAKINAIPLNKRPKVFIEIWHDPLTTAGKGSFIDELITVSGGRNIAFDTKRPYSIFSPEEVINRNPDCIILTYMEKEKPAKLMGERFGWGNVSAVKNDRVYADIDPNIIVRPGPRIAEGIEEIHKRLYK